MAIDSLGHLLVSNQVPLAGVGQHVSQFSLAGSGSYLGEFDSNMPGYVRGIAVNNTGGANANNVYIVSLQTSGANAVGRIRTYSADGTYLGNLTGIGGSASTDDAVDSSGNFYLGENVTPGTIRQFSFTGPLTGNNLDFASDNNVQYMVIGTPVPEPNSLILIAACGFCIRALHARSRRVDSSDNQVP